MTYKELYERAIKSLDIALEELEKTQNVCKEQNELLNNVMEDYTKLLNEFGKLVEAELKKKDVLGTFDEIKN